MERMEELVSKLNKAAEAYYNSGNEIMSNFEYDAMYDELVRMESETGKVLANSPTQRAGFVIMDKLPKVTHEFPALSLDKTKDMSVFPTVFGVRDGMAVVMWKADGSTVQATYDNGKLTLAATRGNGEIGQDITHNAPFIKGLPMEIPYKGHLVVRGEAVMTYAEFERINDNLPAGQEAYKNPRNLANATITLLDSKEMSTREIWFQAFNLVYADDMPVPDTFTSRFLMLQNQGINIIEAEVAGNGEELLKIMKDFTQRVESGNGPEYPVDGPEYPVDGLVVAANDVVYATGLPGTGHNPHKLVGYALKWEDETAETVLREIEWSASRTGLLNPVAIFDPVELEGTTVTRATLHNVSYVLEKNLLPGDKITVFKANKIIPKVDTNLDANKHGLIDKKWLCHYCPVCKKETVLETSDQGSIVCKCINPSCAAKQVKKFVHFCERDCMNIEGLSEATLEKFIQKGWLKELGDIYTLYEQHGTEIAAMEGMGEKSLKNLSNAIEASRQTSFVPFIHALGIPNVGKGQAKLLSKHFSGDVNKFFDAAIGMNEETGFDGEEYNFQSIEGIGEVIEKSIKEWANTKLCSIYVDCPGQSFGDPEVERVKGFLYFTTEAESSDKFSGKTFVITGSLNHYENRDALVAVIEANGGKASGSVSAKTSFLINNDVTSTSGKNKKAQECGVKIISEEQFMEMLDA